jgi:hypothetical protein
VGSFFMNSPEGEFFIAGVIGQRAAVESDAPNVAPGEYHGNARLDWARLPTAIAASLGVLPRGSWLCRDVRVAGVDKLAPKGGSNGRRSQPK